MGEIEDRVAPISSADLAVLTYNALRGKEFPKVSSTLRDLADQTRQVIGTAEMLGVLDAECMADVIAMAMETAYNIGEIIGKPITEDEVAEAEADPEFQASVERITQRLDWVWAGQSFADSLVRVVGASQCCWRAWQNGTYVHFVISCLNCGVHRHGYPDSPMAVKAIESTWSWFTLTHGRCA